MCQGLSVIESNCISLATSCSVIAICRSILFEKNRYDRSQMIEKFVDAAGFCQRLGDYNGAHALVSALMANTDRCPPQRCTPIE